MSNKKIFSGWETLLRFAERGVHAHEANGTRYSGCFV